jgi:hypothetical protein
MHPLFFKHYWSIINQQVFKAMQNFLMSESMLKELNRTFFTLIPKVEGAARVDLFKPINLCNMINRYNVIYKTIVLIMDRKS